MILIFIFSIIFVIIVLMTIKRINIKKINCSFAIFTVFIMKENILFLEEWLDYHWKIGFRYFYLFDNSRVTEKSKHEINYKNLVPGKKNKHGIDYEKCIKMSPNEIKEIWKDILEKYGNAIIYKEWSPKNEEGKIIHDQTGALNYFNKYICDKKKIDWIACIDMDEYIYVEGNNINIYFNKIPIWISNIVIQQIPFESRFYHMDKYVIEITNSICNHDIFYHFIDKKYIYRAGTASELGIHTWKGKGTIMIERKRENLSYMHYNRKRIKNSNERKLFNEEFIESFKNRKHRMTIEEKKRYGNINYVHNNP